MYAWLRDDARWVLPEVLAAQARERGDALFVRMTDGPELTYAGAAEEAGRVAGFLAGLGVGAGDPVAVMLPNGLDLVRCWLGLGRLGGVFVPLNTELVGAFLEHQLRSSGARVAVVDPAHEPVLRAAAAGLPELRTVVVTGGEAGPDPAGAVPFDRWREAAPHGGPLPAAGDVACIMYTSGTTGPSKGVLMPHAHCYLFGLGTIDHVDLGEGDRYYVVLPLFHANGLFMQLYATLIAGGSAVVRPRFSAGAWLEDVRRHEATVTNVLGAVAGFVLAQPPTPRDRDHRLRLVMAAPNPPEHDAAWRRRFGVDVISGFGMTEVNIPIYGRRGEARPGTAGRVYQRYFEVEVRDPATDRPVPPGTVGEIMVRPRVPFGFMSGYHGLPEKTVEAWRNLWFHTGDAAVMDAGGLLTFRDRIKDCIRRRGENVSSFEVEAALARLAGVEEVAAFAVPSGLPGGEDEIMLAVVPSPDARLGPAEIAQHAERALPRFARPRFIELVEALPKTPTAKVQKSELRRRGVGPRTWDRERDG